MDVLQNLIEWCKPRRFISPKQNWFFPGCVRATPNAIPSLLRNRKLFIGPVLPLEEATRINLGLYAAYKLARETRRQEKAKQDAIIKPIIRRQQREDEAETRMFLRCAGLVPTCSCCGGVMITDVQAVGLKWPDVKHRFTLCSGDDCYNHWDNRSFGVYGHSSKKPDLSMYDEDFS